MTATKKYLGIYMDHLHAHIIELNPNVSEDNTITSKFNHRAGEESLQKGEFQMNSREQHQQLEYYKRILQVIKNYDEVVLFGPTDAKTELYNIIQLDHHFEKIRIRTHPTDKLTENQQQAFVRNHFSIR